MKPNKEKIIFIILHSIAAIAIMTIALFGGDIISNIVPDDNLSIKSIVSTIGYIGITLSAGLIYAKYVLHFSFEEIGVCFKAPQLKWIAAGFILPSAITAFYLIFTDGQLIKNNNAASIMPCLINAIFPIGLASGICEEFIFRGLIMRTLERRWNSVVAVLVPSVLFALLHTFHMHLGVVDLLLLVVAGTSVGVMFSFIALQSGTIWSSAVVHALWNAITLGGIIIEPSANGTATDFIYKYELLDTNILLTGGKFGIESALPAIIGYLLVSAIAFMLIRKKSKRL